VIEERERVGGRIFTRRDSATPVPIELGAEFIHGSAPELARVLHEASLSSVDVGGERRTTMDGRLRRLDDFWEQLDRVMRRLRGTTHDESFEQCHPGVHHRGCVRWEPGHVEIETRHPEGLTCIPMEARAAIIAIPLGVLKAASDELGAIAFLPYLRQKQDALDHLAVGFVVRVTLRLTQPVWASASLAVAPTAMLASEEPKRHGSWRSRSTARCSLPVRPPIPRVAPVPSTARSPPADVPHGRCGVRSEPEYDRAARATEIELCTPER
jgi:Flavin containing amine oxidoreductase